MSAWYQYDIKAILLAEAQEGEKIYSLNAQSSPS